MTSRDGASAAVTGFTSWLAALVPRPKSAIAADRIISGQYFFAALVEFAGGRATPIQAARKQKGGRQPSDAYKVPAASTFSLRQIVDVHWKALATLR